MTINLALVTGEVLIMGCDSIASSTRPMVNPFRRPWLKDGKGKLVKDADGRFLMPLDTSDITPVVYNLMSGVTKMFLVYKNPPIVEAICEFRFSADTDWDLTIPGRLHERLGSEYTGKPRSQEVVQAELDRETSALRVSQAVARVQLPSADGTRMVAVGPRVLSVHVLKPYPGWEEFRA